MSTESARYASELDAVEQCLRRGEFTKALQILEGLLAKPLPVLDRCVIWMNVAIDLLIRSNLSEEDRRGFTHNVDFLRQSIPRSR